MDFGRRVKHERIIVVAVSRLERAAVKGRSVFVLGAVPRSVPPLLSKRGHEQMHHSCVVLVWFIGFASFVVGVSLLAQRPASHSIP